MSPPVLLIINADTCRHCVTLLEDRVKINSTLKQMCPTLRSMWLCLDNMNFSIMPQSMQSMLKYVPIVMFFPEDTWDHVTATGDFTVAQIMDPSYMGTKIMIGCDMYAQSLRIVSWVCDITNSSMKFGDLPIPEPIFSSHKSVPLSSRPGFRSYSSGLSDHSSEISGHSSSHSSGLSGHSSSHSSGLSGHSSSHSSGLSGHSSSHSSGLSGHSSSHSSSSSGHSSGLGGHSSGLSGHSSGLSGHSSGLSGHSSSHSSGLSGHSSSGRSGVSGSSEIALSFNYHGTILTVKYDLNSKITLGMYLSNLGFNTEMSMDLGKVLFPSDKSSASFGKYSPMYTE